MVDTPQAELDGYEAYVAGELIDANPYPDGSGEHDAWAREWKAAEFHHGG